MASVLNSQSQEKEGILCANNCGFFGCSETMNFCSVCYKIHLKKQSNHSKAEENGTSSSIPDVLKENESKRLGDTSSGTGEEGEKGNANLRTNRCSSCKKRVGLTGFHCRCGDLFCGLHRYAEEHNCPFDYRKDAQLSIAKSNPVIKPQKFHKF